MGFKLISKKIEGDHKVYGVLGIKFKIRMDNLRDRLDIVEKKSQRNKFQLFKYFTYTHMPQMTLADKMRIIEKYFYESVGYFPNLKKPQSFNEKLNWMKFNYRNPDKKCVFDKYKFKKYIESKLGAGYTVNLLKVFEEASDINFDGLPDRFVIKTTQGFGGKAVKVIKDKDKADIDKLKYDLCCSMNPWDNVIFAGMFGKSGIKQRIIAEEYIKELDDSSCDYKFFCFHGEPKCFYLANSWATKEQMATYYDMDLKRMPLKYGKHRRSMKTELPKPENFDKMVEIARTLSKDFPFVRVDLYDVGSKIYVGELTFSPGCGFGKYTPREWDFKIGEWLDLGKINPEHLKIMPEFADGAKTFIDPKIVETHTVIGDK